MLKMTWSRSSEEQITTYYIFKISLKQNTIFVLTYFKKRALFHSPLNPRPGRHQHFSLPQTRVPSSPSVAFLSYIPQYFSLSQSPIPIRRLHSIPTLVPSSIFFCFLNLALPFYFMAGSLRWQEAAAAAEAKREAAREKAKAEAKT